MKVVHAIDGDSSAHASMYIALHRAGLTPSIWTTGDAFLAKVDSVEPGCVVAVTAMPDMDGLEVVAAVSCGDRRMPCVVVTDRQGASIVSDVSGLDSVDVLVSPFRPNLLVAAVERAFVRMEGADGDASGDDAVEIVSSLSPAERDILIGIVRGRPNKVTAHDLGVSVRTVESGRARMMGKLGASSVRDAIRIAHAAGFGRTGQVGQVSI